MVDKPKPSLHKHANFGYQVLFRRRERLSDRELLRWIRTGDTDGLGYSVEGLYREKGEMESSG